MKKIITFFVLFFLIFTTLSALNSTEQEVKQLNAWLTSEPVFNENLVDPQIALLANQRSVNPSWEDLFEWAWAFSTIGDSGSDQKLKKKAHELIVNGVQEIKATKPQTVEGLSRAVHNYLYRKVFTKYDDDQTRIDEVFLSGNFNCMSSSALYMILAKAVGLKVNGVLTEDHAYILAYNNDGSIAVHIETTNKNFGIKVVNGKYSPQYSEWAILNDPVYFLSTILRNRIATKEEEDQIAESLTLLFNLMACTENLLIEVIPSAPVPSDFLLNRVLYYAGILIIAGEYEKSLDLLSLASGYYSENEEWLYFVYVAVNNSLASYMYGGW